MKLISDCWRRLLREEARAMSVEQSLMIAVACVAVAAFLCSSLRPRWRGSATTSVKPAPVELEGSYR